jgi:FAD binding domain
VTDVIAAGSTPPGRTGPAGRTPVQLPEVVPVDPDRLDALTADLVAAFGPDRVTRDQRARLVASTDWAHMSPVLSRLLPAGVADVVVRPPDAAGIALATGLAWRHRVPLTSRGQGTGNYGQGIPLHGGLVLDTSLANRVLSIVEGEMTAEAGTTFVAMEKAARATGQDLAIVPSTVGSTIGGFIAGGAGGTGSVAHGAIWDGYLHALDVAACGPDPGPHQVTYPQTSAMAHAFGTSGVIATATVTLAPAREWTAVLTTFADFDAAVAAGEALFALDPTPRLVSLDEPGVVATYRPADPAMPPDHVSLRSIVDVGSVESVHSLIAAHGGTVTAVRPRGAALLTSLSFNHVTHRLRKVRPELTHLQCRGLGMTRRRADVAATVPESLLHLEGFRMGDHTVWAGMLFCRYDGVQPLYEWMEELGSVDVDVNDPHTWMLHHDRLSLVREAAVRFDPDGLLNPGKLPPA